MDDWSRDMAYKSSQGVELVFLKKVGEKGTIGVVHLHCFRGHIDLDVGLDGDQLTAQADVVAGFFEHRFLPRGKLIQMVVNALYRSVFGDQLTGSYLTHPFDTRDVVRSVSADGQHVDDLGRGLDAIFASDLIHPDNLVVASGFSGLVLPDVILDELSVILVRSDHVDIQTFPGASLRHGTNHVVRLIAHHHECRDVHRPAKLLKRFQGIDYQLGRLRPVSLVLRVHLVTESPSRRIEGDRQIVGFFPVDQFQDIFGEPEEDRHVRPL